LGVLRFTCSEYSLRESITASKRRQTSRGVPLPSENPQ